MKHNLFKSIVALVIIGATLTTVGCKNYDDQIGNLSTELEQTNAALKEQITTLETALKTAQSDITAAQTAATEAKEAGDKAAEAAAQATAAVANAKAEAIKEAIAECEKLVGDKADQSDLDALASKIEGIEKGLAEDLKDYATVDELTKLSQALDVQKKALEDYKKTAPTSEDLSDLEQRLGDLISDVENDILTAEELEAKVKEINKEILGINPNLSSLAQVLMSRLTSVTLVPDLYIDGIPSIEFRSIAYKAMTIKDGDDEVTETTAKTETIISNENTTARYRLNPTGVQADDITMPAFVSNEAVTRAEGQAPVKVVDYSIDKGILSVKAAKTITESLVLSGGKIYTVALQVPIAKELLVTGEEEAFVYSEYVRLNEATITPSVAELVYDTETKEYTYECETGNHNHFMSAAEIYATAFGSNVTKQIAFDDQFDLSQLVTACYEENGKAIEMTAEELESYGLEFRFEIPTTPYAIGPNDTDQQQFAKITGTTITSMIPGGSTQNRAAIDKEPIVRAILFDTENEKVVDARYFKIKWVDVVVNPDDIDLGTLATFENDLTCQDIVNNFEWADMIEKVYGALNMSKEQFEKIYTTFETTGDGVVAQIPSSDEEDAVALEWTLDKAAIGTIVPAMSKEYTTTITFSDPTNNAGKVIFKFEATVSIDKLPTVYGFYEQYWATGNHTLANVAPVIYSPDMTDGTVCEYQFDLMSLFTRNAETKALFNDMLACGKWDIQFAEEQATAPYHILLRSTGFANDGEESGYALLDANNQAAGTIEITSTAGTNWYENSDVTTAILSLDKEYAKGLINKEASLVLLASVNDRNRIAALNFDVHFIAPLKINTTLKDAEFHANIIGGSEVDCSKAFSMTDFNDYIVAETVIATPTDKEKYATELWKYYEVEGVKWDVAKAKIGMKKVGGSIAVDDTLTADQSMNLTDAYAGASVTLKDGTDDVLVFNNNGSMVVEQDCNIFVPATVTYGWGEVTEWVAIRLKK